MTTLYGKDAQRFLADINRPLTADEWEAKRIQLDERTTVYAANVAKQRAAKDPIGDRMKRSYENASRTYLPLRMPVILRVDGKSFHTYTRSLARPYDEAFADAMDRVAVALCEEAQGAALAFVQSDEISVLLHNYRTLTTSAWFDNNVQKIVSVAASIVGVAMTLESPRVFGEMRRAHFDARVFVLPEAEVANYFLWRQQDATRNSIQMAAGALYSHRELHQKNTSTMQEMLHTKGVNWNAYPAGFKRGRCVVKETYLVDGVERGRWVVDREPPIFSQQREYVERCLATKDEA